MTHPEPAGGARADDLAILGAQLGRPPRGAPEVARRCSLGLPVVVRMPPVLDSGVPVIMLSSKDGLFDKARGRMVGSEDYLTKPFTKDQLLRAVA